MTREELCDWLKTAKDGSKLKWTGSNNLLTFNGLDTITDELNENCYYNLSYIFRYPGEFRIVSEPRIKRFIYSFSNTDSIFDTIVGDEALKAIIDSNKEFGKDAIKVKVTIEELFE
jgi:hypothetical protein